MTNFQGKNTNPKNRGVPCLLAGFPFQYRFEFED